MDMLEVNLDLRIAGTIDLGASDSSAPRSRPLESEQRSRYPNRALPGEEEAAAKNTRQALAAVKQAIKSDDAQRIRRAAGRLKDAATRLGEAVSRGGAAKGDEGRSLVIDADIEETEKRDRKPG
jgi:hypothetical protein